MNKKTVILLGLLVIAPVLVYVLWPSDESRIRKLFREGAKAVEQKNIEDVMAKVSLNYADEYGFTYLYVKKGMARVFQRLDRIEVEHAIVSVLVSGETAKAEVDVRVIATAGQDAGYVIGDAAKPARTKFALEKVRGTWQVTSVAGLPLNF